jgi:hypothetical protein
MSSVHVLLNLWAVHSHTPSVQVVPCMTHFFKHLVLFWLPTGLAMAGPPGSRIRWTTRFVSSFWAYFVFSTGLLKAGPLGSEHLLCPSQLVF